MGALDNFLYRVNVLVSAYRDGRVQSDTEGTTYIIITSSDLNSYFNSARAELLNKGVDPSPLVSAVSSIATYLQSINQSYAQGYPLKGPVLQAKVKYLAGLLSTLSATISGLIEATHQMAFAERQQKIAAIAAAPSVTYGEGYTPGGLAFVIEEAVTPSSVVPGGSVTIGAYLTKNGKPYYAGSLLPAFAGGFGEVKLFVNGVETSRQMPWGAGGSAGFVRFIITAPNYVGKLAITLLYQETVINPVTRREERDGARKDITIDLVPAIIEVIPTPTPTPTIPITIPVIPTRFGTFLRVLAQVAVKGVERIFPITQTPTFFAGEMIKIVAYITYKNAPVKDYVVAFTVDNQEIGDTKTDEKGYAYMPFRIPQSGETVQQQFTRTTNGAATIESIIRGDKRHRFCVKIKTGEGDVQDCQMIVVSSEAVAREVAPLGHEAYLKQLRAQFAAVRPTAAFTPTPELPLLTFPLPSVPEIPIIPVPQVPPVPGPMDSYIIIPAVPKPPGVIFPVEVEIDRERRGEPPVKIRADPGKHQIVISLRGFAPIRQSIQLAAGETATIPGLIFSRIG